MVAILFAFLLTAPHILARPYILALPVMVAWIAILIRYPQLSAMAAASLDDAVGELAWQFYFRPCNDRAHSLRCTLARVACGAIWRRSAVDDVCSGAACLNPYGPEIILVTFRTIALGAALTTITEWRSQDFTHLGAFKIIMLGAFGFALFRGVTLPWLRILMLLGVLHLSLSQARHADLLGMLAPIFLARPLAEQF